MKLIKFGLKTTKILSIVIMLSTQAFAFNDGNSEGGHSGGGGIVNPVPLKEIEAIKAVKNSKQLIQYFAWGRGSYGLLSNCKKYQSEEFCRASKKLVSGNKKISDLLESVVVEFRKDRPCEDRNGEPVDGSVFNAEAGANICISGMQLRKKLSGYYYEPQIAALVLHELSHLAGADDSEATILQLEFLKIFKSVTTSTVRSEASRTRLIPSVLNDVLKDITFDEDPLETRLSFRCNNTKHLSEARKFSWVGRKRSGLRFRTLDEATKLDNFAARARVWTDFKCIQDVNEAEKNNEVALLKKYSNAINVVRKRYDALEKAGKMPLNEYGRNFLGRPDDNIQVSSITDTEFPNTLSAAKKEIAEIGQLHKKTYYGRGGYTYKNHSPEDYILKVITTD